MEKNQEDYITPALKFILDNLPGAWCMKDRNLRFVYANKETSNLLGFSTPQDLIGITDFDLQAIIAKYANTFRDQDKKVIETKRPLKSIEIHPYNNCWRIIFCTKIPFINNNNELAGVLIHGEEFSPTSTSKFLENILAREIKLPIENLLLTQFSPNDLTARQGEVLFFLLRGKITKQIAVILNLSPKTVEHYLIQLHCLFNTRNKNRLIERAIQNGFFNFIPPSLLKEQRSIEISDA